MTQAMSEPMVEALDPVERRLLPVLRCFLAALQALLALLTAGRIEGAVVHAALSLCALLEGRQTSSRSGAAVRLAVVPGSGAA